MVAEALKSKTLLAGIFIFVPSAIIIAIFNLQLKALNLCDQSHSISVSSAKAFSLNCYCATDIGHNVTFHDEIPSSFGDPQGALAKSTPVRVQILDPQNQTILDTTFHGSTSYSFHPRLVGIYVATVNVDPSSKINPREMQLIAYFKYVGSFTDDIASAFMLGSLFAFAGIALILIGVMRFLFRKPKNLHDLQT